jgi:hypothetical protein
MFRETVESRVYLRAIATKEAGKDAQITVGYSPKTPNLLSLGASHSDAFGSDFCYVKFAHHLAVTYACFGTDCCHERFTVAH